MTARLEPCSSASGVVVVFHDLLHLTTANRTLFGIHVRQVEKVARISRGSSRFEARS
jgi:hypothetical protein